MGLVGESGCGKSTTGRTLLKLLDITDGEVIFNGEHIENFNKKQMRKLRTKMQLIFQDPYSSLSPRLPVGEIIGEAVREHGIVPKEEYDAYISKIMNACGLQEFHKDRYPHEFSGGQRQRICIARAIAIVPKEEYDAYISKIMNACGLQEFHKDRYPHEFSGGQRQRICIARAIALNPDFIVCDEPVSALDVSIQAQVINLLEDLQKEFNLTYLFISHDLSVVEHISDTVGVMYLGGLVEVGATEDIFANPLHPYTKALFSAIPIPDPDAKLNRILLEGSLPSPANPPTGCKFHTRCKECMEICKKEAPTEKDMGNGHKVRCHLYD